MNRYIFYLGITGVISISFIECVRDFNYSDLLLLITYIGILIHKLNDIEPEDMLVDVMINITYIICFIFVILNLYYLKEIL